MSVQTQIDRITDEVGTQAGLISQISGVLSGKAGGGIVPSGTMDITANGNYDVTNYANAEVNVPGIVPSGTKTITENGTHEVTNYAKAQVNVPGIVPTGTKTITENGTFDISAFASVIVNVASSGGSGGGNIGIASASIASDLSAASPVSICNIPFVAEHINDSNLFVALFRKDTNAKSPSVSFAIAANSAYFNGCCFLTALKVNYNYVLDTTTSTAFKLNSSSGTNYNRIYANSAGNIYVRPQGDGYIFAAGDYVVIYGLL